MPRETGISKTIVFVVDELKRFRVQSAAPLCSSEDCRQCQVAGRTQGTPANSARQERLGTLFRKLVEDV